jgi:hypothetical protein
MTKSLVQSRYCLFQASADLATSPGWHPSYVDKNDRQEHMDEEVGLWP